MLSANGTTHDAETGAPTCPIDDRLVGAIAEETATDTRSVTRRLAGLEVRGKAGVRIDAALSRYGLAPGGLR